MAFENCDSIVKFMLSHKDGYDAEGYIIQDRALNHLQWATIEKQKLSNGLFYNDNIYGKVETIAPVPMQIKINQAFFQINGHVGFTTEDLIRDIDPADNFTRTDRVVLQLNHVDNIRDVRVVIKKNDTTLKRTPDIWELGLADIRVRANVQTITNADITDIRLNPDICGIVDYIYKLDTDLFYTQIKAIIDELLEFSDLKRNDILILIGLLETQAFALINNNFDDISVKKGCDLTTEFNSDDSILETYVVVAIGFILATRLTIFNLDDTITITTTFHAFPTSILDEFNRMMFNGIDERGEPWQVNLAEVRTTDHVTIETINFNNNIVNNIR